MSQSFMLHKTAGQLPYTRAVTQLVFQQLPRSATVDFQSASQTMCSGAFSTSISTRGLSTHLEFRSSAHTLPSSSLPGHHYYRSRSNGNIGNHPMHLQISFSTASEVEEPLAVELKSKRTRTKKDPITITPRAAERVFELLSSPNAEGALGIRLGVKRRGCNGLSYTLNYAFEREKGEEEMTSHGLTIFVEPMALFSIVGTVMDWEETDLSSEFTFINPNSKGECGCGESFNV